VQVVVPVYARTLDPAGAWVVVLRSRREHGDEHVLVVQELDPDDLQADNFVTGFVGKVVLEKIGHSHVHVRDPALDLLRGRRMPNLDSVHHCTSDFLYWYVLGVRAILPHLEPQDLKTSKSELEKRIRVSFPGASLRSEFHDEQRNDAKKTLFAPSDSNTCVFFLIPRDPCGLPNIRNDVVKLLSA